MEDLEASYNEMLAGDRADNHCHKTENFYKSFYHSAIVLMKAPSQIVTPVLHIKLWTVLTNLLTKTQ